MINSKLPNKACATVLKVKSKTAFKGETHSPSQAGIEFFCCSQAESMPTPAPVRERLAGFVQNNVIEIHTQLK